ncbi:MAG TPA: hypothetical protein VFI13_11785 [Gemmatimonadales bacterium]|nr:hypothetical protein [Gemmatimonadales bacterium]
MRPIRTTLPFLLTLFAVPPAVGQSAPPAATAPRELSDSSARQGVGARVVVTGPVVQVKDHARMGAAYLNFGARFPNHTFSVIIPDSVVARFGYLMRFEGHTVRATGVVWLQDGKWPAMTITDPAALELVP